jgi:hypothetical protein
MKGSKLLLILQIIAIRLFREVSSFSSTIQQPRTFTFSSNLRYFGKRSNPRIRNTILRSFKSENGNTLNLNDQFDAYLEETSLSKAILLFDKNPEIEMTRSRWENIFNAIERRTTEAEENAENTRLLESNTQYQVISPARTEMTNMYRLLAKQNHLRLFGASREFSPAAGSHTVTPMLLEQITNLTMVALTPKPTNTLLLAGAALAIAEGAVSISMGWDFNFLVLSTLLFAVFDRVITNGAASESFVKVFNPGVQEKIIRHEAGHFLCAYLLGLPVEGCVLSAWAARQDARFDKRQVTAGTSFFDPELSDQINKSVITRSSIDRYSIVVMAGIAAEAIHFGRADGGAGDEMALVTFLSQLNGRPVPGVVPVWNNESIRNQARWGALQAILLLREYKEAYDALVDALERGGNLGDCIYAIENAGRNNDLQPLERPLGLILDEGMYGTWTTDVPIVEEPVTSIVNTNPTKLDKTESLETLRKFRELTEERLKQIDEKLKQMNN